MIENPAMQASETLLEPLSSLDRLCALRPELAGACAYYRELLPLLRQAQQQVPDWPGDRETLARLRRKLARGEPMLPGEDLPFHPAQMLDFFIGACRVAERVPQGAETPAEAASIRQAAERGALQPITLLVALFNGDLPFVSATAQSLGLAAPLFEVVGLNALRPFLFHWVAALQARIDTGGWKAGTCPFCGSRPLLGELRSTQRARSLRCGLCGGEWAYHRLTCAHCGNTNPRTLGVLRVEDEPDRLAVQTCDACGDYLKMVATFEPLPAGMLLVADLSTLHLDWIAARYGYQHLE